MNTITPAFERKNSVPNEAKMWISNTLMNRMDRFAHFRGFSLMCFMGFFLGNNLGLFLYIVIAVSVYLQIYRFPRFYVKRWLMYLMEFCYFGNALMICFVILYPDNLKVFYTSFVCSTGIMSMATIVFNNQVHFHSTDHLSSSFIHATPLITVWAIRWRHVIYSHDASERHFKLINLDKLEVTWSDFCILQIYPLLFWGAWATFYFVLNSTLFNKYLNNPKYGGGVREFREATLLKGLFGDRNKYTLLKYLFQHFLFFNVTFPLSWISFFSFEFNTLYVVLIIFFLAWNTGRANLKILERKLIKEDKNN